MKTQILVIIRMLLLWLLTFAVGKVLFMCCCHGSEVLTVSDFFRVWWHGLPMDLSTSAYLLSVLWLALLVNVFWRTRGLRLLMMSFNMVCAVAVVTCIVTDIALYPFWGFKLDATIFNYIDSPSDALASVSVWFVVWRVLLTLVLSGLLVIALNRQTWRALGPPLYGVKFSFNAFSFLPLTLSEAGHLLRLGLSYILLGGVLFLMLRGGVTESTMNVGNAYFSTHQFLNHSAVNPVFSLFSSTQKNAHFNQLYRQLPEAESDRIFNELYKQSYASIPNQPHSTPVPNREVTSGNSPNILLIVWEGCGGQFTEAIGGRSDVVPNLDALIDNGLFFSQLRANSFRTDRGLLSILSGYISYPTHSLMKMATKAARLPSIAHTLHEAGYENTFMYGGDVNFTNMKGYLLSTGYDHIVADTDFSRAARATSKWGVCDSILFERLWQSVQEQASDHPQFITALTLSSHEPWDVPGHRNADPKLNTFAYTDAQLGRFMDRLKASPHWDSTLVIILPDHGVLAGGVTKWDDPRFFHIPMVWTGGALQKNLQSSVFPLSCSQSDLAATLLSSLGLPHDDFFWSRDVFNPSYTRYPFTYSTFVDGFAFTDSTGTTIYDNISRRTLFSTDAQGEVIRRMRGQALQQKSYDLLERL